MLTRDKLRKYQVRGVNFVKRNSRAGLFIDMGLGKTIITLTAIVDLLKRGVTRRVLIVAPVRVMRGVWRQEAQKWQHTKHLTFKCIDGTERERLQSLTSRAEIFLISPDNLPWLMRILGAQRRRHGWPFDMLVIDESSMFKTPNSKRFSLLRHRVKHFQRRVVMTGTPAPRSLVNLWSQVFILDEGERLCEQVDRFRKNYFRESGYMGHDLTPDDDAAEKITEAISDIVLTMRAEDHLELPPVIDQTVYVELPLKARRIYRQMEEEMYVEMDNGDAEATTAAVLSSKCWQMANGFLYLEDSIGNQTWQAVHDAKIQALKDIVAETSGNLLVAYWFKPDLARLRKAFPKAPCISAATGRDFERIQREWNAGKHPVMFIHPAGGGHGLNLQDGGNTLIFYSMLWGREAFAQCKERMGASRQVGKASTVQYKYILARDTVDEVMMATQRMRHDNERAVISMLRHWREVKEMLA